ncbi:hypothetical protein MHU86_9367 [Fragilaria crotonensis]|nr:hypothetical protein MHU86_9367 [Fragilaria crotonensis]
MVEPAATSWDLAEPLCEGAPFYSDVLKADLHPGTFVLLEGISSGMPTRSMARSINAMEDGTEVVARVVALVSTNPSSVSVNIFRFLKEVQQTEGLLYPNVLNENHLRHLTEIVQTTELRVVPASDVVNLSFVFTMSSLQDPSSLFFTCQGMYMAFLLRFRFDPAASPRSVLTEVPEGYCLPFPSNYRKSRYHDCFAHRVWNNLISIKMEIMRLLGRYSQQQGLFGRERGRLTNITSETWGFLDRQFSHIFGDSACGSSSRVRVYRVTESGLVIKAARVRKVCSVMRFETKTHLRHLSKIFGESVTAGQRCRLQEYPRQKRFGRMT